VTPAEPARFDGVSVRGIACLAWSALWWAIAIGALWRFANVVL
jgi:hypothetical protein